MPDQNIKIGDIFYINKEYKRNNFIREIQDVYVKVVPSRVIVSGEYRLQIISRPDNGYAWEVGRDFYTTDNTIDDDMLRANICPIYMDKLCARCFIIDCEHAKNY